MAHQIERSVPAQYVLHKKQKISDICENGVLEYYYPKYDMRTRVLEFEVEGNSDHLIIPNAMYLRVKAELQLKSVGTAVEKKTEGSSEKRSMHSDLLKGGVVNNIIHSLFESTRILVCNEEITKTDRNNAYHAYLATLCNYGKEEQETYFTLSGWNKDKANAMDGLSTNVAWMERQQLFAGSENQGEFIAKIMSPLCFQAKALPTQVSLRVILNMASPKFYMMYDEKDGEFDIVLKEAVLMVQKVNVVSGLRQAYIDLMEEGHPVPYFLKAPYITHFAIDKNSTQFIKENMFQGKVPLRIVLMMVLSDAYAGKTNKNPFNFQHFGLTEICIYRNGMPYPRPPIKMDVESGVCAEAYHHFMSSINAAYSRRVPNITYEEYKNGYFMIGYNMSPDQMGSVLPGSLVNGSSNIRLEMRFKRPLTENVTLLVYHEYEHIVEIHRDRRVSVEY